MENFEEKEYYIDIDQITKECQYEIKEGGESEINVFKYETIRTCIERVLSEFETEEEPGDLSFLKKKDPTLSFSIAFNTLKHNNIIKETDGEE